MRIGIDISQTGRTRTGCGYLAAGLVDALSRVDGRNDYLMYTGFGDLFWDAEAATQSLRPASRRFRPVVVHESHDEARAFWQTPPADAVEQLGRPQIIHSNNFFCPSPMPGVKLVYMLYDLSFLEYPQHTTEANRLGCFDGVFRAALHADRLIAISRYTRSHFLRMFPHVPDDRVVVAYPGNRHVSDEAAKRPAGLDDRLAAGKFWLSVGTLEPRKNPLRLLEAYARLKQNGTAMPLVHAGKDGWLMEEFPRRVEELGLGGRVIRLGYSDEATVAWLYQNCFGFVYPSLFEGFGLPVLEAMSQGAPCVVSDRTSLPEVVGEAGLLVDPYDPAAIAAAMQRLIDEPSLRGGLRAAGRAQAARFSWDAMAETVLGVYRELVPE